MADLDGNIDSKDFGLGTPQQTAGFPVKGAGQLDFGMRHRLARIFAGGERTVMLAFDHGYFQGPTSGLERVDLNIVPLAPYADALMATRGIIRSVIPAQSDSALVLRASGGPSILRALDDERIAMDMADAVRIDAAAVAVQVFVGAEHETQSIHNLTTLVDAGYSAGVPVLGIAGTLGEGAPAVHDIGIGAIASILTVPMPLEEAVANGEELLRDAAERSMRLVLLGSALAARAE